MAFGKHWEWRGFGAIPAGLGERLEALPLKFPESQELTDEYLWAPGCSVNVKLRFSDLKFKRQIDGADGLERWLEDPSENHSFPIADFVLAKLARDLRVLLPPCREGAAGRKELLGLLDRASPPVRLVAVKKSRWQREWTDSRCEVPVTVEVAEILTPEKTWSVGLEHQRASCVRAARDALGLEGLLTRRNYLEALGAWAEGRPTIKGP